MGAFNRNHLTLLVAAAIAAAVLLAIMVQLDRPLRTNAAPLGIVSFELAGSPEAAREIMASWGPAGQRSASLSLWLDYAFLISYALVLSLLCTGIARGWPSAGRRIRRLGFILAGCQWLAALLDLVENILLQQILTGASAPLLPLAARWCALIKFSLIACGWLYIVIAGGGLVFRKRYAAGAHSRH